MPLIVNDEGGGGGGGTVGGVELLLEPQAARANIEITVTAIERGVRTHFMAGFFSRLITKMLQAAPATKAYFAPAGNCSMADTN